MNRPGHEFDAEQNQVLSDVSKRMRLFAGLMIATSILSLGATVFQLVRMGVRGSTLIGGTVATGVGTVIYVVVAYYTISAASSLESITTSEGADESRLLDALRSLKTLFGIQYWLIVLSLLAIILMMIGMFFWMAIR